MIESFSVVNTTDKNAKKIEKYIKSQLEEE